MALAIDLLDELIAGWLNWETNGAYYVKRLAVLIALGDDVVTLTPKEKKVVRGLKTLLSEDEWQDLPALIARRKAGDLHELASDRQRTLLQAEAERQRNERERERERLEQERLNEERARAERRAALLHRLKATFSTDFLEADRYFVGDADSSLLTSAEYDELRADFVRDWSHRELPQALDSEQAAAVATASSDTLVIARAGSGKTTTLVGRAIFLQRHCHVSAHELMLVAFNRKAADEIKARLTNSLGDQLPHVMTFHALAHALVHPEEQLIYDDPGSDQLGLSRELQTAIDEHIRSGSHSDQIKNLMLAHFREDWERIVAGRFHLAMDEFLSYRRALPRESLRGELVKSFGERVIANTLFEHGVEYQYERSFRWGGVRYRPDFALPVGSTGGVVIEYFGMEGDPDYDAMSRGKREFWSDRPEWKLLEFSARDLARLGVEGFAQELVRKLRAEGIRCERRTEEEIWSLVKVRAVDRFTEAMRTFAGRARKANITVETLAEKVQAHIPCSTAERLFLSVAISIYGDYLQRLHSFGKEDFDGLMWRAVKLVQSGQTGFTRDRQRERGDLARLRFILVDEFQDLATSFFELLAAARSVNPQVQLFFVGDDWQAINGFAGSEVRFLRSFEDYFPNGSRHYIRTNFRSASSVVEIGNAVMAHDGGPGGVPIRTDRGLVQLCRVDDFEASAAEQQRHAGDDITPAVARLCRGFLDRGLDIAILARRRGMPWYVNFQTPGVGRDGLTRFQEHIRSLFPEADRARISASTVHAYKGLEASAVILLDVVDRSYPLIHPNWVLTRVFGDTIERIDAEERRLLYVAITRAKDALAIVTDGTHPSPYLADIQRHVDLAPLSWAEWPPCPSLDGASLEVRVHNSYQVRDQLKALGYRWNASGRYWYRAIMADGFSIESLHRQAWAKDGVRIEVLTETGDLVHRWRADPRLAP